MRVCIALLLLTANTHRLPGQTAMAEAAKPANQATPAAPAISDEDKADELSEQVGKLMVKCVNLLTAQDPLSLEYCKQQRDLADQYPPHQRMVDKMMAHDEYGIALAAFDHKQEALAEFDQEVALAPAAVKPGSAEWSTAYWHRAMIYNQLGQLDRADRDYRTAEAHLRTLSQSDEKKRRTILRQHAAMLQREGRSATAQRLLEEAAK